MWQPRQGGDRKKRLFARQRRHLPWSTLGLAEPLERRLLLSAAGQAYTFQNVNIGGGGFVDGVFFSPTQPNVAYARTDIGGAYKSTDGGNTWSELLDFVGNASLNSGNGTNQQMMGVLSLALDPENANNIYLDTGEYSTQNGAVLSSHDGGQTFSITNLPFSVGGNSNGRGEGERLAVDPNKGNILLLGSDATSGVAGSADGLWISTSSGASFTQVTSFPTAAADAGITFVTFDPSSGTPGNATQTIYVGVDSTAAGSNIYRSTNGGASWSELPSGPTGFIAQQGKVASDGNVYFTFANAEAPNGNLTNGAVWRFTSGSQTWTNISPVVPGAISGDNFGYDGVAVDPENPDAVAVTSFDRYGLGDTIWHTNDASDATPVWTALFQFQGYGGGNTTRDTSVDPWIANFDDGIGNWAASVAIDPFNSNHLMYGNGQGLWATNDATSDSTLTAADSWYFHDTGIEFTAVGSLSAPQAGVSLFAAMGDINGFAFNTLTQSPAGGGIAAVIPNGGIGSMSSVDTAGANPLDAVIVGSVGSEAGAYSTDDGNTWTEFAANPGGTKLTNGTVAMSADGSTIVWAPSGQLPYYTTDDGTTWTAATVPNGAISGGTIISDRINPNYFYYWTENSNDNAWTLYISSNGGHSFTASAGGAVGTGNVTLAANPHVAGDLWISSYIGLYHSTNFGASFVHVGSSSVQASALALGASAPGATAPAIYLFAVINGFDGLYRSDDGGATFIQLNDTAHQFGGLIQTLAADPNVFGRFYFGTNGRGIIMGNPASALPTNFADADINSPGNPGFAYSSTTLSTGAKPAGWVINGGGSGIGSTTDQLNFAYEPVFGDVTFSAQLTSLDNPDADHGTPAAGIMIRAGADDDDPFVALLQTTDNQLELASRSTIGGTTSFTMLGSIPVGAEFMQLVRNADSFTASYSSNGSVYTTLGSGLTLSAIPATADLGLTATAGDTAQVAAAKFANIVVNTGVTAAPKFTNTGSALFSAGSPQTFTITATGAGPQALALSDNNFILPAGLTFTDTGGGIGVLAGTPTTSGTYTFTLTATNGINPAANQRFTLTVDGPSTITSPANATFTAGKFGTFAIAASGFPQAATIFETGLLPPGVTLVTTGTHTAELEGIPAAAAAGTYTLTLNANNGASPLGTQSFTLVVDQIPAFITAAQTTFTAQTAATFTIRTTGLGPATTAFTETGSTLPAGITFTDNGDGTATLAGTAAALTGGTYKLTLTATNGTTPTTQLFTLTINQPSAITSAATATFTTGKPAAFPITASGFPVATTFYEVGPLPAGITLLATGTHSAELHGVPAPGSGGTYAILLVAHNGLSPADTQAFTLVIDQPPAFTSPAQTTFVTGNPGTFLITTTGTGPNATTLTPSGATPPNGITFTDNGDGTATLAGTPAATTGGTYKLTITAANGTTATPQDFTLTVDQPVTFTSAAAATFTAGKFATFAITTSGFPTQTAFFMTGGLPPGLTLLPTGPHTAVLTGIPAPASAGTYTITLNAHNGLTPLGTQPFTLVVDQPPAFISRGQATFLAGQPGTFTIATAGLGPTAPTISETGATLPKDLNFTDNGDGTATLSGTPMSLTGGTYKLTLTANNGTTPTPQPFTLTVDEAAQISSANTISFTTGTLGTFNLTATGYPTLITFFEIGALPAGVMLMPTSTHGAQLRGVPASTSAGTYSLLLYATNGLNPLTPQSFTLIVNPAVGSVHKPAAITPVSFTTSGRIASTSNSFTPAVDLIITSPNSGE